MRCQIVVNFCAVLTAVKMLVFEAKEKKKSPQISLIQLLFSSSIERESLHKFWSKSVVILWAVLMQLFQSKQKIQT